MDAEQRKEALQEYYCLQQRIGQFDQFLVAIKSLSVTATGVIFAAGVSLANDRSLLYLIAFFAALIFWYIEAQWKSFQTILIRRCGEVEDILANNHPYNGPGISNAYAMGFRHFGRKAKRFLSALTIVNVWLPQLPIAVIAIILSLTASDGRVLAWLQSCLSWAQGMIGGS